MPETIDFSIIIPTRNRPAELAGCLDALRRLQYPESLFEVVIIDDGSRTPVEPVVASRRGRLSITLANRDGGGPARARNAGAALARGRFLAFTDDDCRPAPNWVDELSVCLRDAPQAIVGGRTINALETNIFSAASQGLVSYLYDYFNGNPARPWFLASNNIALSAETFRSIGGFNSSFPTAAAEDRDFCDRLRARGSPMMYASSAVVYHSHALTLRTFCSQHFGYGRGAFRYRRAHQARTGRGIPFEPLRFYSGILGWPFRNKSLRRPLAVSALIFLSQAANAGGFFWEWVSQECANRAPNPKTKP